MLQLLKRALPWALIILLTVLSYRQGYNAADAQWKQEVHNEYVNKDTARKETQRELNELSAKYQADYAALEGSTDRIIADLQRDKRGLYVRIKAASGTTGPDGRCLVDGPVELHESTSKALIELTQKADLKERTLQEVIRKLTKQKEK
ncbi:putative spanin inner membrane subunit [Erwinia phage pEp_SNUABM_10]|uniref:Rz-like lysis protein n=1 Tax=Erwinia phage pEp_SNUABM_09 TaxID=2601644 RepID=A0A5J6DA25_9CAUD|nr:Rz-like lysis protein [Erwinia phage pEp_SNUABM_09]QOC57606.1 putative spanin inner membrane subunit [Erwinia phage pEp_SNUABM_03]QOC57711.1 putative spanin inner membrane subunit [Erwinia phage pEp_SNUABM_10]QOC57764.1 putative spanin inner membrane subunit [Erwinia phage pEp_SNUABM_11]